jgi:hypothetical protein
MFLPRDRQLTEDEEAYLRWHADQRLREVMSGSSNGRMLDCAARFGFWRNDGK